MICDSETNIIYFSDLLKTDKRFSDTFYQIKDILDLYNIPFKFLPKTKDVWVRDFMPIQVNENKHVEYRYDPDYLRGIEYRKLKSYPGIVCSSLGLKTNKTDIILDGGNVVKSTDCVIMTDKVLIENNDYNKEDLLEKLKSIFKVEKLILIPWDKTEYTGHADGMIRFIDENTVLLNGYHESYDEKFKKELFGNLEQNGLDWKFLKYDVEKEDKNNWAYINFLQTKDLIIVPKLSIDEDEQAIDQIKKCFPEYEKKDRIFQVDATSIVKEGGAFNCISWTIKE